MNPYTNAMLIYTALLHRMGVRRRGIYFIPPHDLFICCTVKAPHPKAFSPRHSDLRYSSARFPLREL